MSKLTVTLPDDLHAQIRQELEEQGITTGQFIEMVVTKYLSLIHIFRRKINTGRKA